MVQDFPDDNHIGFSLLSCCQTLCYDDKKVWQAKGTEPNKIISYKMYLLLKHCGAKTGLSQELSG